MHYILCQEEEETSLHFLGRCSATMICRHHILGSHVMDYSDLSKLHWSSLLKFTKASKRLF